MGFPKSLKEDVAEYLKQAPKGYKTRFAPYQFTMGDEELSFPDQLLTPIFEPDGLTRNQTVIHYCLLSRHNDGHMREAAIRWLVGQELPEWATPYLIAPIGEMVIEVAQVICDKADQNNNKILRQFAQANPKFIETMRSRAISYWHEYYRRENSDNAGKPLFESYQEYPPYKFLEKLKKTL
jgi:hypothetical protein